jgi:HEAT repeat protein
MRCERDRDTVIYTLAELGPAEAAPFVARVVDPVKMGGNAMRCLEAAADRDAAVMAVLTAALASPNQLERSRSFAAISRVEGSRRFEWLLAALDDPDEEIRGHAIAGLRRHRDVRALDGLMRALRRGHWSAAVALGELGDPRALDALVAALATEDAYHARETMMKGAVIEAIGDLAIDDDRAWSGLVRHLRHTSDYVADLAAIACQQLRPGCDAGHARIVRRFGIVIPDEPNRLRGVDAMVRRLGAAASRATSPDRKASGAILAALESLRGRVAIAGIDQAIVAWRSLLVRYGSNHRGT